VLPDLSEAVNGVRHRMVGDLEGQARASGASGILGLQLELAIARPQPGSKFLSSYQSRYWLMTHAIATAISQGRRAELDVQPVISLKGT
jgi:hypothetical protein